MAHEDDNLSFWDHLDELRSVILRIVGISLLFGIVAFCFKDVLFDVVLAPSKSDFITYRLLAQLGSIWGTAAPDFSVDMINTLLSQQFIAHMKTAFYAGLFCALPYMLFALMQFVVPALGRDAKRYTILFVGAGYIMFLLGVLLGYFVIFPLTFRFLATYMVSDEVVNMISLSSYMATFTSMNVIMGVIFEMPILCWLFAKLSILKASFMRQYRRHAIVLILVVAAIITPTSDIFTLFLVSLPMWLLYELSIAIVALVERRRISVEA